MKQLELEFSNEVWKDIPNYEGYYQASNLGRIRSLDRRTSHWCGGTILLRGKIMILNKNKRGYCKVTLCKLGISERFMVHRLICIAFLDNPLNKPQVNHINGIRHDNNLSNLEWCTASENILHAFRIGLLVISDKHRRIQSERNKLAIGALNHMSVKVIDISTGMIYDTMMDASKSIGLSSCYVGNMLRGFQPNRTNLLYLKDYVKGESEKNIIQYPLPKKCGVRKCKIIDTSNGIIYESIVKAVIHSGYKLCRFGMMLKGKVENKTTFKYYNNGNY